MNYKWDRINTSIIQRLNIHKLLFSQLHSHLMSSRKGIWIMNLWYRKKDRRRAGRRTLEKGEIRTNCKFWSWHTSACLWLSSFWLLICRNHFSCRGVCSVVNICTWREAIDCWRSEKTGVIVYASWRYLLPLSRFCKCCVFLQDIWCIGRIKETTGSSNTDQDWYWCRIFWTGWTEYVAWCCRCRERISRRLNLCRENWSLILIWMITLLSL